jgi:hypothetical protein
MQTDTGSERLAQAAEVAPASTITGATITHVTVQKRDFAYNHSTGEAAIPVDLHFAGGHIEASLLILRPGDSERLWIQIDAAIDARGKANKAGSAPSDRQA